MREKLNAYYKALEVVQVLGQSLLKDDDFLPDYVVDLIEDIDIATYCLLQQNTKEE